MDALIHQIRAWDGLLLHVKEWRRGAGRLLLLCLPGFVRTSGDFRMVAERLEGDWRMVSIDYAGRGQSGRSPDIGRYAPEACLRDVLDVCAALHVHRPVVLGTSFGGLLAMGIGVARPGLLRGVVLNDVGPEIGREGGEFIHQFVAHDPALPNREACITHLRAVLPPLSLAGEDAWRLMAELTYGLGADGLWHPLWDTRIARLLESGPPELWPLFRALGHVPLLLLRGELSTVLLPETVAKMRAERPDMEVVTVPGIGHGPTLTEPEVLLALQAFLGRVACA
jgi:pimeloyl-ACP methyl ester carboxylesterase